MSNMDERLKSTYLYGRNHDNAIALVYKFSDCRTDKSNKEFVFVEGRSDESFYKNTSIDILSVGTKYIYSDYISDGSSDVGKKAVCDAYKSIRKSEDLVYDLDKCIFLIDRDYDDYKKEKVFTVTLGHSMECYFLEKDNIEVLFRHFGIEEAEIERFYELYLDLSRKTAEFFALKGTIKYMYDFSKTANYRVIDGYRKKNSYEDIFNFTFENESYKFDEDKMIEEIGAMKKSLDKNTMFKAQYTKLYNMLISQPRMMRGHDVFRFLQQYLFQKHQIVINNNLKEVVSIIKEMNVDIDIKQINCIECYNN